MPVIRRAAPALPAAAGGAWSAWLAAGDPPAAAAALVLAAAFAVSLAAFIAIPRRTAPVWRLSLHAATLAVSATVAWLAILPALLSRPAAWLSSLHRLDASGIVLAASPLAAALALWLWTDALAAAAVRRRDGKRKRAKSDLYGKARLLGPSHMRTLSRRSGILLGQRGPGKASPLIAWNLEGCAVTVAPPRAGKGALIALNYLSPGGRGFRGSTVLVDPRGETFCVVARRRREMGRRVVLLDPFGVAAQHAEQFGGAVHLPDAESARYNPFDFIRDDEARAVRDINVLLDALLTPPGGNAHANSRHFYESARSLIAGYMAWIRFREPPRKRNLAFLHELISKDAKEQELFARRVAAADRFCGGLAHLAVERQSRVGKEEGGSNFTTIANQLSFMTYPELAACTASSTFDPVDIAAGDADLFVVAPEELLDHVKGWIRLWITIPNAVPARRALERDLLVVLDEMPRLGYLKPVMDGYNMAAGKGIHFWSFAQSISALDAAWGKEHRTTLTHLAEVVQVLGFPRMDADGAEELSKAIGSATWESRSENVSGTVQEGRLMASSQSQAGETVSTVKERLVTPDDLMTMGPDEQYVVATAKDMPRDALHLRHARYWARPDSRRLADPNPFVLRKRAAVGARSASKADA